MQGGRCWSEPPEGGRCRLLPISEGLKEGLGLEMGVFLCPCYFILWWFGSKMFTRNTHTTRGSTDFLWASQARSCCCGFSLQSCQSRSDFPSYPPLPMARTCSKSCLLLLWHMQRPRAPQGQSPCHPGSPRIAVAADGRKSSGRAPRSGVETNLSIPCNSRPSPGGSHPSVLQTSWSLPCS